MNFELSEDQRQLSESLQRFLGDAYGFEQRRKLAATETGWSRDIWKSLVELGVTALPLPAAHGGFDGSAADLLPVNQAFGRALLLEPFLPSVVLGATAVRHAGTPAQCAQMLPAVASGESVLAWAHDEAGGRHAPLWVTTAATRQGDQWLLNGAKHTVLHAAGADRFIVSARTGGTPAQPAGVALFVVDAGAAGLAVRGYRLIDDSPAGDLTFTGTPAQLLGDPANAVGAAKAIAATQAAGIAAVCADMVGCMEASFKLTVDYLNTRKQFNRLIGENQTLRHRASEMLVSLESCRSMALAAAAAIDDPASDDAGADLSRAKLLIGRHARAVCQSGVQMHGGIGMTEEYAVGHYLRRVTVSEQLFGDSDSHAQRLYAA